MSSNPLYGAPIGKDLRNGFLLVGLRGLAKCRYVVLLLILTGALILPSLAGAQSTGINELDDALELQISGHLKEALEAYAEVIKQHPRSPEAYNWRGMAYEDLGEIDKAIADFNQAIEISPNYADAYNNRGEAYRRKKMYPQAVADFQKAVSIEPSFAEAYYNLGLVYEYGEKKNPPAAAAYDNYLKNNPRAADRDALREKIKVLKGTATAAPTETPAATTKPEGPPGAKPAGPPGVKPVPGAPPAQVQKPPAPGTPPGQKPPSAVAPGTKPGMPAQKPGVPPRAGVTPAPPGPQLPVDVPLPDDLKPYIAMAMGLGVLLLVVPLVFYLFIALMFFLIARKTNTGMPWLAFIPIAQYVLLLNIAGKPIWWIAAFLLPLVGSALSFVDPSIGSIAGLVGTVISMIAWLLVSIGISNARGKSVVWGILLFLPCTTPIALAYLALSK